MLEVYVIMIRILHIVGSMNQGGIENFIMNIYRNIDRQEIQFDFCTTKNNIGFFDEEIKELGGKIFKLDDIFKIGLKRFRAEFEDILMTNQYSIVHCHMNVWCSVFLPIAKRKNVKLRIAHSHISGVKAKTLKNIVKIIITYYVRKTHNEYANVLFACSMEAAKWLFGKDCNNTVIVKNGIDIKKYVFNIQKRNEMRDLLEIKNEIVIGHVGRFVGAKNHIFIVKVFREYYKKNHNGKLLLIGEGKLLKKIKKEIKEYHLEDRVIFAGIVGNVCDYMQAMDIMIMPSLFEGLPLTVIEAQSSGLPILLSETISKECQITDRVRFESLDDDVSKWASNIEKMIYEFPMKKREEEKLNFSLKIKAAGFDSKDVTESIRKIYCKQIS